MFTGIVTHLGQVKKRNDRNGIAEFEIQTQSAFFRRLKLGDSVCVNGVCLTVAKKGKTFFQVQAVPETLQATNLGLLEAKSLVNLEPSCRVGDELGGHFVTGHVDAVGRISKIERGAESLALEIQAPESIIQHLVVKGSIALDGISLTVQDVKTNSFKVAIIPYTLKHTNLKIRNNGSLVNLEADLFAKYIRKYVRELSAPNEGQALSPAMAENFLKEQGF